MEKIGIDISKHNGIISFAELKDRVDFVIIRAGYGQGNVDALLYNNVQGCIREKIPFGFYWFSYAFTEKMAENEALKCIDLIKGYKPEYPIYFDFEYDSDRYATEQKHKLSNGQRYQIAKTFCRTLEKHGYYAGVYTNIDYLGKGFADLYKDFAIWLAAWTTSKPKQSAYHYQMWQFTDSGKIAGVSGKVDLNRCYVDYPKIIAGMRNNTLKDKVQKKYGFEDITMEYLSKYKYANDLFKKLLK